MFIAWKGKSSNCIGYKGKWVQSINWWIEKNEGGTLATANKNCLS